VLDAAPAEHSTAPAKIKRLNPIKLRQLTERCEFLEEEIPRLESAIASTEETLANFVSAEETMRQTRLIENLRAEVESLTTEWEDLTTQLEEQNS
jgi:ATP-binding cassette subfamily F protein 3